MKALAFTYDTDLLCADCFEKYLIEDFRFANLLIGLTKTKKVNSDSKCKECGKEYGCKVNQEAAQRLSEMLK